MDAPARSVTGLTPSSKALWVAASANALPHGVVLYVVPGDVELEQTAADVSFFLSALEGLSEASAARAVLAFPSHEVDPYRGLTPHLGVTSVRAAALHALATGTARVVIASAASLLPRISAPQRLLSAAVTLRPGIDLPPSALAELLGDAGFTREDPADSHGEFAVRGGIVDVYPAGDDQPVRLEYIGDTIDSLRRYDPSTQRSVATIDQVAIVPLCDVLAATSARAAEPRRMDDEVRLEEPDHRDLLDRSATIFDFVARAAESRLVVSERDEVERHLVRVSEQVVRSYEEVVRSGSGGAVEAPDALFLHLAAVRTRLDQAVAIDQLGLGSESAGHDAAAHRSHTVAVRCQPTVEHAGRVGEWVGEIRRRRTEGGVAVFVAATPGRAERTIELLKEYDLLAVPIERADDARYAAVLVAVGHLSRGFHLPDSGLHVYAEADVFEEDRRVSDRRRMASRAFLPNLRDLKVGDLVVHVDHGIGMFVGLKHIDVGDAAREFLELRYAGDDKLFVPVERLDLVQKYSGGSRPPVDRLGGTTWARAKAKVKKAMRDMAEELLKLYAARKAVPGHAFSPDSHWQQEFEDAFEYELTPDQRAAIADIKSDMESATPMDRLLCGDVGYGKTEVAMRAAFKAAMDGKQVAFLAPTTVLAFQHQKTLKDRFAAFPVRIEMISRFRSKAEQKQVAEDLRAGRVDIIVGTHRLLSKDIEFRDLGLLVVDEEQRFGVAHKEKIKQLRKKVDVLTMSATPIPRTLNMSLVGIRDMSLIETPPKDRLSIQTSVLKFDQEVIRRAVRTEMARGGQVYFVHNRVESIFSVGSLVQRLVPEARIVVGHGQMSEDELERAMLDFIERKFDVLLATTIVENGLDIPNANTILINRADRYGLSQLYQLRGRVGRSDRPAYAYLLVPPDDTLSPVAKKRLAAIKEFSDLGSGFRVAALDLEIRGAGNLLGGEQSGHIEAVGFEMYMNLLEEAVRELKGLEVEDDVRASVNLGVDLRIEEAYVPDMNQRLMLYRKVASARQEEDIDRVVEEALDRYGPLPDSVRNLADYGRIRVLADRLGVESLDRAGDSVTVKFGAKTRIDPGLVLRLVGRRADLKLVPPGVLRLDLGGRAGAGPVSDTTPARVRPPSGTGRSTRSPAPGHSWWTARARAGQVAPGFSKTEILRKASEDPRTPGGLLDRVGSLLSDLLAQV